MIVELLRNEDNKVIGWQMTGESPEEINKLKYIRDLSFWGSGDTAIDYNGRRESDDANNNPGILSWKQRQYIKH
jgi:hypothetical protein